MEKRATFSDFMDTQVVSQFLLTHPSTRGQYCSREPYCSVRDDKSSDDGNDGGLSKLLPYLQVGEVEVK